MVIKLKAPQIAGLLNSFYKINYGFLVVFLAGVFLAGVAVVEASPFLGAAASVD